MWPFVLYAVAGALELTGLLMAWVGFTRTWSQYDPEGRKFRVEVLPIARWTAPARMKIETIVRRLARRPKSQTVHAGSASAAITFGAHAVGRIGFTPLPSITDEPEAFAAEVDRRLSRVLDEAQDTRDFIADETRARAKGDKQLQADLDARAEDIERLSKSVAIDGLVLQGRGWLLVFAGVVLGTMGNFLQAA